MIKNIFIFSFLGCIILNSCFTFNSTNNVDEAALIDSLSTKCKLTNKQDEDSFFKYTIIKNEIGDSLIKFYHDGYFYYKIFNHHANIVFYDSVPRIMFINDSIFDANGDNYYDLLINYQTFNGKYQSNFCYLFCYHPNSKRYIYVKSVSDIPNPKFDTQQNLVTGYEEVGVEKTYLTYKWKNSFELQLLSSASNIKSK